MRKLRPGGRMVVPVRGGRQAGRMASCYATPTPMLAWGWRTRAWGSPGDHLSEVDTPSGFGGGHPVCMQVGRQWEYQVMKMIDKDQEGNVTGRDLM